MSAITIRHIAADAIQTLTQNGVHPLLAQIYAARGIANKQQLATNLERLHAPAAMRNLQRIRTLLADAIALTPRRGRRFIGNNPQPAARELFAPETLEAFKI